MSRYRVLCMLVNPSRDEPRVREPQLRFEVYEPTTDPDRYSAIILPGTVFPPEDGAFGMLGTEHGDFLAQFKITTADARRQRFIAKANEAQRVICAAYPETIEEDRPDGVRRWGTPSGRGRELLRELQIARARVTQLEEELAQVCSGWRDVQLDEP